jgi:signal transduction histidine kinase
VDPLARFRCRSVRILSLVLGGLALPSALVNAVQAVDRADPFLGVLAIAYLVGGGALLSLLRQPEDSDTRGAFLFWAVSMVLAAVLTETPAGSSHMLGIASVLILLLGQLAGRPRHRRLWHVFGAATFPIVLFARELYRPHPLLDDPLELVPQALAGGCAVYGFGILLHAMLDAFAAQTERAREAEAAKDRFLETMSHELRTPLTAILGYTEILEEEGFADVEASLEDLGHIHTSSEHLLGLIDDLLDLSRLASGADSPLDLEPVSTRAVIEAALNDVAPQLERNRNQLVRANLEADVLANAPGLRRVLVNLLGNAAKFTADGTITVTVVEQQGQVAIEVADTGVGFPDDMAERIFQPFAQADDTRTRVHGGTGLGLAISRRLVEAMNGSLTAVSKPGGGSTFSVRLDRPPHGRVAL